MTAAATQLLLCEWKFIDLIILHDCSLWWKRALKRHIRFGYFKMSVKKENLNKKTRRTREQDRKRNNNYISNLHHVKASVPLTLHMHTHDKVVQ